jgi:hypothetical protein
VQSNALSLDADPDHDTGYLVGPFAGISQNFLRSQVRKTLTLGELQVMLTIISYTAGFLRQWCVLSGETLATQSNISRAYLFEIIKSLEAKQLIMVGRTNRRCNKYALGPQFEVLNLRSLGAQPGPTGSKSTADRPKKGLSPANWSAGADQFESGPADSWKDMKENIDHHHQSCAPQQTATQLPVERKPVLDPVVNDDVLLHSVSEVTDVQSAPEVNRSLVKQLQELGVTQFMAYRLAKTQPVEKIEAALARVKSIQPEKPAGYIVAELQRGGYSNAPVDRNKAVRESHEQLHERRKRERELDEQLEELKHQQTLTALEFFECLPAGDQAALRTTVDQQARTEGFWRLPNWSPDHPTYRGLLSELIRGRYAHVEQQSCGAG